MQYKVVMDDYIDTYNDFVNFVLEDKKVRKLEETEIDW